MERSVSSCRSSFSPKFWFTVLIAIYVVAFGFVGYMMSRPAPKDPDAELKQYVLQQAAVERTLDAVQEHARDLTVRINTTHKLKDGSEWGARATGIVVKPGVNGKGRILTNGHVCDAVSIPPQPLDKILKMSVNQTLFLPIEGSAEFEDGKSVKLNKIIAHKEWPDLCVIELAGPSPTKDFAEIATTFPGRDERMVVVGHPGGDVKLAQRGPYQGTIVAGFPPRFYNPIFLRTLKNFAEKYNFLAEVLRRIQFVIDWLSVEKGSLAKDEIETLYMLRAIVKKELERLMTVEAKKVFRSTPAASCVVNTWSMGGASGSGIWNNKGQLLGIVWGSYAGGSQLAFCVPLTHVTSFMETVPK